MKPIPNAPVVSGSPRLSPAKIVRKRWKSHRCPWVPSSFQGHWKDEGDAEETLKQDVLDAVEKAQQSPGHIVASAEPIPASNKDGDNPPHAKAKQRYEEIATDSFLCTQEHP